MSGSVESALAAELRRRGGRVTPQRLAIARLVDERKIHVTAEEIYGEITDRLPGVSLPTVYATLELLEELGHVSRVPTSAGPVLFDTRSDLHDHMICNECGGVTDLDAEIDHVRVAAMAAAHGFHAERSQLVVEGLCGDCGAAPKAAPAKQTVS